MDDVGQGAADFVACNVEVGIDVLLARIDFFVGRIHGHRIEDRFSEDLDLTLDTEHFTQSQKRNSVKALADICLELGLTLVNRQQIEEHTHGNYNCFVIEYPIIYASENITPGLKVEMTYLQKSYPYETVMASSYITDFLAQNGNEDIITEYGLDPFDIKVQSLERTLIDKVFAIGDYYLSNAILRTSRHIYDISRLLTRVDLSAPTMKELATSVRNDLFFCTGRCGCA